MTIAPGARSWGGAEVRRQHDPSARSELWAAQFILGASRPAVAALRLAPIEWQTWVDGTVMCLREAFGACRGVRAGSPFWRVVRQGSRVRRDPLERTFVPTILRIQGSGIFLEREPSEPPHVHLDKGGPRRRYGWSPSHWQ